MKKVICAVLLAVFVGGVLGCGDSKPAPAPTPNPDCNTAAPDKPADTKEATK